MSVPNRILNYDFYDNNYDDMMEIYQHLWEIETFVDSLKKNDNLKSKEIRILKIYKQYIEGINSEYDLLDKNGAEFQSLTAKLETDNLSHNLSHKERMVFEVNNLMGSLPDKIKKLLENQEISHKNLDNDDIVFGFPEEEEKKGEEEKEEEEKREEEEEEDEEEPRRGWVRRPDNKGPWIKKEGGKRTRKNKRTKKTKKSKRTYKRTKKSKRTCKRTKKTKKNKRTYKRKTRY